MKSKLYLRVIFLGYVAVSMAYYVAGVAAMREQFFHAGRYAQIPVELGTDGQTLSSVSGAAQAAGLSPGDRVLAVDGIPFTGFGQIHDRVRACTPGMSVRLTVQNSIGTTYEARIPLLARKAPAYSAVTYAAIFLPVLVVPLLGLLVGYWIVGARPGDLNAWLVLILLTFPETAYGNLDWSFWPAPWYLWLGLWNTVVQIFVFPALMWFGFLFPERWRADVAFPWVKHLLVASSGFLAVTEISLLAFQFLAIGTFQRLASLNSVANQLSNWVAGICVLLFLGAILDKLHSASTADARRRLRVLAIGSSLSLGPLLGIFAIAPLFHAEPRHGRWVFLLVPLLSLFPLTLAYVLVVQRAMGIRILLRIGTQYLLARATITIAEILLVAFLFLRFVLPMMRREEHPLLNFLLLFFCFAALSQIFFRRNSLGQMLQRWMDRRFFRDAYRSEHLLGDLSEQVRRFSDPQTLFDVILQRVSDALHVSSIAVLLREHEAFRLRQAIGFEPHDEVVLPAECATIENLERTNRPATLYPDRPEPWFFQTGREEKLCLEKIQAELLLPVSGRSQLLGVIALGAKRSEEPYTPADMRTLQSVAAQAGLSLEVGNLARELASEAAQRERVDREMEIAREVQQRLFPQSIPRVPGLDLAGMCRPASEVGGDYYDLMLTSNGHLGFAIGDVSGKGISAALIMASLRASLRGSVLDEPGDLARIMQKVNQLIFESSSSSRYATFFFAVIEPDTGIFRYCNAGHNPPVLLRRLAGEVVRLEACGPVVGLFPHAEYEARSVVLHPGDLVIGYTDGISEAMTAEDEEWGEERMIAATPNAAEASSADIVDAITRAADAFTAGAIQHDDMTLLVLKMTEL